MNWVCVCVFIHNEREREIEWGLIEELLKWFFRNWQNEWVMENCFQILTDKYSFCFCLFSFLFEIIHFILITSFNSFLNRHIVKENKLKKEDYSAKTICPFIQYLSVKKQFILFSYLSPVFLFFFSLVFFWEMKTVFFFLAVVFTAVIVTGVEYTESDIKLQTLLGSLCTVNKENSFGSCCTENDNATSVTTSDYPPCFGSFSFPDQDNGLMSVL